MVSAGWKYQKDTIRQHLKKPLIKGDAWYVIDIKWFSKWKLYVNYDSQENDESNSEYFPGPINNSSLIDRETGLLKDSLLQQFEFDLIPEESWEYLVKCYGVDHRDDEIELVFKRNVVSPSNNPRDLVVEVHLFPLKICCSHNMQDIRLFEFSHYTSLCELYQIIRRNCGSDHQNLETRLLREESGGTYSLVTLRDNTILDDSNIQKNELLIVEVREKGQEWTLPATKKTTLLNGYHRGGHNESPPSYRPQVTQPGVCGLTNLGNTCFMNSALQCVSNVKKLTDYFLTDEWQNDINYDNPLGMQGEIAKSYAILLKNMWSGTTSTALTRDFKKAVAHFAPQFSGYSQHDSHELLMFLLDGLHEDLNRVQKKPYIEIKDADGRRDEIVAGEAWDAHRKRNDSIIVSLFHGLLKSTVVCPQCKYVSVTFDPYSSLSLPLPNTREYFQTVYFVPSPFDHTDDDDEDSMKIIALKMKLNKNGFIRDLQQSVGKLMDCRPQSLVIADIHDHKVYQFFDSNDLLNRITPSDTIFAYKLPESFNHSQFYYMPIYFRLSNRYSDEYFDHPQLIILPKRDALNYCDFASYVYKSICFVIGRIPVVDEESEPLCGSDGESSSDEQQYEANCKNRQVAMILSQMIDLQFYSYDYRLTEIKPDVNPRSKVPVPLPASRNPSLLATWNADSRANFYRPQQKRDHESMSDFSGKCINKPSSLLDCFSLFTKEEQLGEQDLWYCKKCKEHKQGFKHFALWDLPSVLVLHLKRFSYGTYFREKIDTPVDFPLYGLDLNHQVLNPKSRNGLSVYDLVAVSNHMGGLGGGHYTSYAKNPRNNKWYHFDDSYVTEVNESEVQSRSAYVLFYVRRSSKSTNASTNHHNNNNTSDSSILDDDILMEVE